MPPTFLRRAWASLDPLALGLRPFRCPACGPSLLVRLATEETAVRCLRCRASAVTLSLFATLNRHALVGPKVDAYETSSRGPLLRYLRRRCASVVGSEYLDNVPAGSRIDDFTCQDLHALTYEDARFDLVTASEVFEHVADEVAALGEVRRVLRPGGVLVMSVPLDLHATTIERACGRGEDLTYLLPPTYHGDRIRGDKGVLVYRDYGLDLPRRLLRAGFRRVLLDVASRRAWFGFGRAIVVARR